MKRSILLLLLGCFLTLFNVQGQWSTVSAGNWNDGTTWNTGTVPQAWGNITVTISHNVTLDIDAVAATIDLTVDASGALVESGCHFIAPWNAGSNFVNNGTIDCYQIDLPSGSFTNNSIVILDHLQMYNAGNFVNNATGNVTASQIAFYNTTDFTNHGSVNVTGLSNACYTAPGGVALFEFSGDDFINNGSIDAVDIGIYNCTSVLNSATGVISSDDFIDISTGAFVFDNFGSIDMLGEFVLTAATFNNYNAVSVGTDLRNNNNAFLNNYGCDCYTQYSGVIDITGNISNNTGVIDNNGIINVLGGYVSNTNQIGASLCGKLNTTSTGVVDNSGTLFGDLVIVAATVNCFSCTIDPSVHVTTDETVGCDYALILPVELVSFDASKIDNREVLCEWNTNVEINSDYFAVERTQNGTSIDSIGWHSASGNSLVPLNYKFIDIYPLEGISYYRLKSVDTDGSFEYSNWRSVDFDNLDIINLYPNPTTDNITVLVGSSNDENVNIVIVDAIGRIVHSQSTEITAGITAFHVNVSSYASGTYGFKVQTDSKLFVQKQFIVD
jgi:hypothetical protein